MRYGYVDGILSKKILRINMCAYEAGLHKLEFIPPTVGRGIIQVDEETTNPSADNENGEYRKSNWMEFLTMGYKPRTTQQLNNNYQASTNIMMKLNIVLLTFCSSLL